MPVYFSPSPAFGLLCPYARTHSNAKHIDAVLHSQSEISIVAEAAGLTLAESPLSLTWTDGAWHSTLCRRLQAHLQPPCATRRGRHLCSVQMITLAARLQNMLIGTRAGIGSATTECCSTTINAPACLSLRCLVAAMRSCTLRWL
jgi:hypothetical protein